MKKLLFTSLFFLFTIILVQAQRDDALLSLQESEWKTFKEFIRYSEEFIPDTNIDVHFYYLDIAIAIDSHYIQGLVTCNFEPMMSGLEEIRLSLNSSLTVNDVTGDVTSFVRTGDSIMITLDGTYGPGDALQVMIDYEGEPVLAGGYKGLRYESHHLTEPIIATLSTPYLAHYWYPCKDGPSDKPDSVYIDITIPVKEVNGQEVIAVSNGILENIIDNTTEKTYQWRHRYPIVTYYVMAAISNYVMFSENYTGIYGEQYPLDYYVFAQDLEASQDGVEDLPLALDVFSEKFGEYPFSEEKYGMTQLGFYGAIENQTNTITNNMKPNWFMISVHELGHMWFGDMITCGNWHHGWLNEGFASYSEAVYVEAEDGTQAYKDYVSSFEFYGGGTLYLQNANDTFNTFPPIIYDKGAYVLHMLRGVLGDDVFWDCIYTYSTDPDLMYGQAITEDLQTVCEDVLGEELGYFFEQWIYDAYYPQYNYNFENRGDSLAFVIKQVQEQIGYRPLFTMPVQVKLEFVSGGDTIIQVFNDEIYQVFTVPVPEEVSMIIVDPEDWILCQKDYEPDLPVSLSENENTSDKLMRIYPNPIRESATIEILSTDEAFEFTLFDISGKSVKVMNKLVQGRHNLIRDDLPSGIYFYNLWNASHTIQLSGKVIFQ